MSRSEIKKLLNDKTYEQAIGFLRITEGKNILDATSIHPESYEIVLKLLSLLNMTVSDIGSFELKEKLENINKSEFKEILKTDIYTLEDIIASLIKPNRDPRDNMPKPLLRSDILKLEDLTIGMKLQGTVRNVVDFGAFIDIGLKNDGLAHISKLANRYIKHPNEVVSIGDIVDVYVDDIFFLIRKKYRSA
jgi:protein Tex